MHKLTVEVDLDLFTDSTCAAEIVSSLIGEMELLKEMIYNEDPKVEYASGISTQSFGR
jgi:hypothetical protein